MKERCHSTPVVCPGATEKGETVSIYVDSHHPLLQLKRALPWAALFEVMTRRWAAAGKNIAGGPGLPWEVSLYVPLVVLMIVKNFNSRQMEAYLAENGVARVFIARQAASTPQIRDHASLARAYAALGRDGIEEVNALILISMLTRGCCLSSSARAAHRGPCRCRTRSMLTSCGSSNRSGRSIKRT